MANQATHEIRFCRGDELPKLQDFLHRQWRADHIFTLDANLLRWQHFNRQEGRYNFVVADNRESGQFDAVLGFIPLSHYDLDLAAERDIWLAIWKADEASLENRGLGIRLLSFLKKTIAPRSIGSIGLSPAAMAIYDAYGYTQGTLNHYFRMRACHIARLPERYRPLAESGGGISANHGGPTIRDLEDMEAVQGVMCSFSPKKSVEYLLQRYVRHPLYIYRFWGIYLGEVLAAVFVVRKIWVGAAACLRIVDIYGEVDKLTGLGACLDRVLAKEGAEYIDCLNHGIPQETFTAMGFARRLGDELVIPHHFEPFEQVNIDVAFAYRTEHSNYVIFKGDSDQDRPNLATAGNGSQT